MAVGTALRRSKNLRGLAETRWPWGPVARGSWALRLGPQAGTPGRGVGSSPWTWPHAGSREEVTAWVPCPRQVLRQGFGIFIGTGPQAEQRGDRRGWDTLSGLVLGTLGLSPVGDSQEPWGTHLRTAPKQRGSWGI